MDHRRSGFFVRGRSLIEINAAGGAAAKACGEHGDTGRQMTHGKSALGYAIGAAPLLATLLWIVWPNGAGAQQLGDIAAGRHLSQTWCGSCHLVAPDVDRAVSNGVPTFVGIARDQSVTALSLRVFLQTPHAGMPDLHLSRDEIDDLAAYILSLRSK
jgi:mono/diheme cytochrome c family protein